MALEPTAKVSVYKHCECEVCRDPKSAWWECRHLDENWIADYLCSPVDDFYTSTPDYRCVKEIKAKHPGCDLVYIGE